MDGIHDMGGMHGFGRVVVEANEPVFHEAWEGRVLGMANLLRGQVLPNVDAFRRTIERLDPAFYLTAGYYGRWLAALAQLLVEAGVLAPEELAEPVWGVCTAGSPVLGREGPASTQQSARSSATENESEAAVGVIRAVEAEPRFAVGQAVRARNIHPRGHTRLPRYARGRRGVVDRVHPACVFPDTHAHGLGENPQYVYSVRFAASELWGEDAEPDTSVHLDLFEDYLEEERGDHGGA
jgi:nitrile hydratase beta subunit